MGSDVFSVVFKNALNDFNVILSGSMAGVFISLEPHPLGEPGGCNGVFCLFAQFGSPNFTAVKNVEKKYEELFNVLVRMSIFFIP